MIQCDVNQTPILKIKGNIIECYHGHDCIIKFQARNHDKNTSVPPDGTLLCQAAIAASAWLFLSKRTKPTPFDCPVNWSQRIRQLTTVPQSLQIYQKLLLSLLALPMTV